MRCFVDWGMTWIVNEGFLSQKGMRTTIVPDSKFIRLSTSLRKREFELQPLMNFITDIVPVVEAILD